MTYRQLEFQDLDKTNAAKWCQSEDEIWGKAAEIRRQNMEQLRRKKWPEKSLRMSEKAEISTFLVRGLME